MKNPFHHFFDFNKSQINKYKQIVNEIHKEEEKLKDLKTEDLKVEAQKLKELLSQGRTTNDILPMAYALVREASGRVLNQRHFDTQLMAGIALHEGKIAEQKTGEGKTLTATLPLFLNGLTGKGAHLVTVNDYLARIHAGWMGQVFDTLGLTTSAIISDKSFIYDPSFQNDEAQDERLTHLRPITRKEAYAADITYGINSEFGFDYLRDNMAQSEDQMVQRGFHFAIVDEADSVLIDEARTPHIISAPVERDVSKYYDYAKLVRRLEPVTDYVIDEKLRTANLTDAGIANIESALGVDNIYEKDFETLFHVEAALKAQALFKNDKDYIVANDEVVIVDEFTGRLLHGRRFSEGLHQAIEAKENVSIKQESKTLATVSLQNYFRAYEKLAGMTGTAATEAEEFNKIYKTDVVVVPTNRPMVRQDLPDMIFKNEKAKFNAVVEEILKQHANGRPVLVGTTSIDKNEYLSTLLKRKGVAHELLNAKNHEKEAAIIAKAGEKGAVTVATNMAGRGVDIILGGVHGENHDEVAALGGLCVIGTERHETRRIDNQLRGRSGRQGDPGSSQFFVSLEDDLMRIFGGDQITKVMNFLNFPEDQPLSHGMVSKAIEGAQQKVEGHNFDIRKHLVEYDDVLNKQREIVYSLRRSFLSGSKNGSNKLQELVYEKMESVLTDTLVNILEIGESDEKAHLISQAVKELSILFRISESEIQNIIEHESEEKVVELVFGKIQKMLDEKKAKAGEDLWNHIIKVICLSAIDNLWTEHLTAIEDLREGINLRGFGQMDPLIEYKNEAFRLFEGLMHSIDMEIVKGLVYVEIKDRAEMPIEQLEEKQKPMILKAAGGIDAFHEPQSGSEIKSNQNAQVQELKSRNIGRNDPCYCGAINEKTGKPYKYKQCGLINAPWHKG
ncbi:MAG: preprotein translocase subunit SecA [Patescibacteria group bacterium]